MIKDSNGQKLSGVWIVILRDEWNDVEYEVYEDESRAETAIEKHKERHPEYKGTKRYANVL